MSVHRAACLLTAALLSLLSAAWAAEEVPTPTSLPGGKIVSADEARKLIEAGGVAVFDMRKPLNYGKGHLKGAASLPYDQKSALDASFDASEDKVDFSKLPADKKAPVLFYSDGPTGWKSYKMAVLALRKGYKQVYWMREGTNGWIAKNLPLE